MKKLLGQISVGALNYSMVAIVITPAFWLKWWTVPYIIGLIPWTMVNMVCMERALMFRRYPRYYNNFARLMRCINPENLKLGIPSIHLSFTFEVLWFAIKLLYIMIFEAPLILLGWVAIGLDIANERLPRYRLFSSGG